MYNIQHSFPLIILEQLYLFYYFILVFTFLLSILLLSLTFATSTYHHVIYCCCPPPPTQIYKDVPFEQMISSRCPKAFSTHYTPPQFFSSFFSFLAFLFLSVMILNSVNIFSQCYRKAAVLQMLMTPQDVKHLPLSTSLLHEAHIMTKAGL